MKVSLNLNQPKTNNVKFEGYKPTKSEYGKREYEFNFVYDNTKQDCYLEIFLLDKDADGNWFVTGAKDKNGNVKPVQSYDNREYGLKLESGKATKINLATKYGIRPDQPFAYHYKLYPKGQKNGIPEYKIDAGNIINNTYTGKGHDIYNFVTDRLSTSTKGGAMKLIVPDCNNVSWVYNDKNEIVPNQNIEQARKTNKNTANKIGGSLAGIEKDLDDGKLDNFTRIITTPIFTDDDLSAHAYWNKNCFQMANSLGNINNYTSLQRKLFAKGINLVSDGAYVNEGLEGVHFRHVLKWGEKSPYFNWFKISGLQDSPLSMGVFGKKLDHVTHRVVNSKYEYTQGKDGSIRITTKKDYNSKKPTYIQIYDDRLVNTENLKGKELIKAYDKMLKNNLEINNHNDTVIPYSFPIDNETYKKNAILINDYNKSVAQENRINLKSGQGTRAVSQFEYFGLDGKHESGFETWDANPDIANLSFVQSHSETQTLKNIESPTKRREMKDLLKRKNMEVQDYVVSSAKFWTKKTNQILTLNVAQHLKNIDGKTPEEINNKIDALKNEKVLPKDLDVNENIIKNVLRNRYELKKPNTEKSFNKAILQGLMDVPLDSIEVGSDIVSVLASPYVTKRATTEEQIGVSRYDTYLNGNKHLVPEYAKAYNLTDNMYKNEMSKFAEKILKEINNTLPENKKLSDNEGNTTTFGQYAIPLLTAEIAKFAVIKGISPDAKFSYNDKTGEISYNYTDLKNNTSLIGMGIIADSPEDEAISLIKDIKKNIGKISTKDTEELTKALKRSINGTNADSFKLAQMIVSRAQAGLDWRIDATKDIADIESIRNGKTDFEYTWNQIIDFWSKFTDGVKEYHPDAYIAAEVTDEADIFNKGYSDRFSSPKEAVKKLINEAGFTTTANYSYFSSSLTHIFGKEFDFDGKNSPDKSLFQNKTVMEQLIGHLTSGSLENVIYSYIFAGNHDKCRTLDGYAMDMDMVYTDLSDKNNYDYRYRAYKILNAVPYGQEPSVYDINNYDFDRVSSLAIAKCEAISSGMGKALHRIGLSPDRERYVYGAMLDALKNLAQGYHFDEVFEAEGFGTKDYPTALDIVLDEMDYIEPDEQKRLTDDERQNLKKKSFEMIIDPAMSKLLGQTKFLAALTGNPTLFAGDEYGATGYETTTKNITVQNRNVIHEEWTDVNSPEYMDFVKRFKDNMDYQFNLRTRKELQPLNDGAPVVLNLQNAHYKKPEYENNFDDKIKNWQEGETQMSALLRQSPNGAMTVSVFNTEGLTHKFDEYYRPAEVTLDCINLNGTPNGKEMAISGLKSGMKFKNADKNDTNIYYVNDKNQITGADNKPIRFKDSVLTLYHEPSFTGRKTMYNPQYNFVSQPYAQKKDTVSGSKLSILSK